MKNLPTGTVTFLFTDIEGSTTLLQRLGDRCYAEVLAEHHRLLRDAFAKGNGQEIDTEGDAFLVAFSRARDALGTAVAAQRALARQVWPDGASLRVRMGLHTGEPLISRDTAYVGIDVHRAARIAAAGHGGQILLSDATYGLVAKDLPDGVSLRDLGEHRLKDLAHQRRLFQVVAEDLPADFPPITSLDALPNNLPRQLTSFIGREKEMAEVKQRLSMSPLLTLTGSAGCGKTRLALEVASRLSSEYGDGVWCVELASLSDPTGVPAAVASVLGVREQVGRQLIETLANHLRTKTMLLLLDNCEHLLSACAELCDALLRQCSRLRIVATSRAAFGIEGELRYRVPSLSLPDLRRLPPPDALCAYEAVRLFVDRAAFNRPGFAISEDNAATVARVCAQLDGIPLAIELAAARVRVLSVEQIADRLDDRFRLLTRGSRTAVARQQTLRATMDWSYGLLSDEERTLLHRLSVFAGGWPLEAAEGICFGGPVEAAQILNLLGQLVDKSLVMAETQTSEARYRLIETVRQYGRDRLVEAGEAPEFLTRHRDWYLALAEQADAELPGRRQQEWLQRLEAEHENLRSALLWSRSEPDVEAALRLAGALQWFWADHGYWGEARAWLDEALGRSDARFPAKCRAYQAATFFALLQGDRERAAALGQKGMALCDEAGDRENGAMILLWLGRIATFEGDYAKAIEALEESLRTCRDLGKPWLTSMALAHLGRVVRYQGAYERAAEFHLASLALAREAEDTSLIALSLTSLGIDALRQGDHDRAAGYLDDGLRVCSEVRNRWITVECLKGLAGLACSRRRDSQAARLYGAAESLRETIGFRPSPGDQAYHDERLAAARTALGASEFEAAWAEGRAMTLEQAIEYALNAPESDAAPG